MDANAEALARRHDRQQDLSYDPYGLMPPAGRALPPAPRVYVVRTHLERARRLAATRPWARLSLRRLIAAARKPLDVPAALPVPTDQALTGGLLHRALRNALAYHLTERREFLTRAVGAMDLLARDYPRLPVIDGARATGGSLGETHFNSNLACACDLLAATDLSPARRTLYQDLLRATHAVTDSNPHYSCINHNTHNLAARLHVGAALGDRQIIHDALYGWRCPAAWRHGLAHQLRHDFLADGAHWERTPGYHMYVLAGLVQVAVTLENLGVDLWHAWLPALLKPETETGTNCIDQHRAYGPRGSTRSLKSAFDAIIYQGTSGGHLSLLNDTGLVTILTTSPHYGTPYNIAWKRYGDPKYAWLINQIEHAFPDAQRQHRGLPMSLQNHLGDIAWIQLEGTTVPPRRFSFATNATIGQTGRNRGGCTLMPSAGLAVLRSDPADAKALNATIFWGPHSAGHQSPAALHVDLFGNNRRATDAPHSQGYGDPAHLTWVRTTIAHNTVTVDGQPMFPYDLETESTWEADTWRNHPSDGVLELFQPDPRFKAVRASNSAVYPGVRLERTLVVTKRYVLDVFRATSTRRHQYDWALHCLGQRVVEDSKVGQGSTLPRTPLHARPAIETPIDLGKNRGYRHLTNAQQIGAPGQWSHVQVRFGAGVTQGHLAVPTGAVLILADDPPLLQRPALDPGWREQDRNGPDRTAVIVRAQAKAVVFVSLWQVDADDTAVTEVQEVRTAAQGTQVVVATPGTPARRREVWRFPARARVAVAPR